MQTKPKVKKKNKTNHGNNIPCVDSLISWASLIPNPLGCCLWSFCLYKEIWMPSTVSDMSWSVFRSWVWMEYPLFSQQKIYGYPSCCWFQSAISEAGFSSMSGRSTIIPDIVIVHLRVLYPLLVLPQETTGTLIDKVFLYLAIRVQQTLIPPQCPGYSHMLSVTYKRPVCRCDRSSEKCSKNLLIRYRQICI